MIPYKSKVTHAEDYILSFYPLRQKKNSYPRKEKNFGYDSIMVPLDNEHSVKTIISENADHIGNIIVESRYSVLSYLQIVLHTGDKKYNIYSSKT